MRSVFCVSLVLMATTIAYARKSPPCGMYTGAKKWALKKLRGKCKKGKAFGYGEAQNFIGWIYKGSFKAGHRTGKGTLIRPGVSKYVGNFYVGYYKGKGVFFHYPTGTRYVGRFEIGYFNGKGTLTWSDGVKYTGQWKNNVPLGCKIIRNAVDSLMLIRGKCTNGFVEGWAKVRGFPYAWNRDNKYSGFSYTGNFKKGKFHGRGTFTNKHGFTWTGKWEKGKGVDGSGTWGFSSKRYKTPNAMYVFAGKLEAEKKLFKAKVVYNHITSKFPNHPVAVHATNRLNALRGNAAAQAKQQKLLEAQRAAQNAAQRQAQAQRDAQRAAQRKASIHRSARCLSNRSSCLASCTGLSKKGLFHSKWQKCRGHCWDAYRACPR